jgi:DNA-binding transcriptional regulator YbjK
MTATPAATSPRGARSRRAILDATLRVLRDAGLGGVTHRAVAAEAGVSVALTTYHFASKDDLLEQALLVAAEETTGDLRARLELLPGFDSGSEVEQLAAALAGLLLDRLGDDRLAVIAVFELYVAAARRPELKAAMAAWSAAYLELVEAMLVRAGIPRPRAGAMIVVAVLDGLSMTQLTTPSTEFGDDVVRPALERLLAGLRAAS